LCEKLDVEVASHDLIGVDNDAIVQELTEDEIVSEILMERNGASGDDVTPEGEEEDNGND
jgi:hypothetical protein